MAEAESARQAGALFLDANPDDYRKANGKVPGATLLTSYREYEPARELPADKNQQLIFYCASRT